MSTETRSPTRRRSRRNLRLPGGAAFSSLVTGAIFWEATGRLLDFPFFPPLSDVLYRLIRLIAEGRLWEPLGTSMANLGIGLAVSVVTGIPVGIAMGLSRRIEQALDIYVNAMLTAPALVFAPIFFAVFGLSRWSIVALVIQYTVFIIIISTMDAVRSVDRSLVEMGRVFNASRLQIVRRIVIPSSLPLIFAGVRLGTGRAVKGLINGEMFIAAVGLGAMITAAGRRFDAEMVLALLIVVVGVAVILATAVQWLDRRLTIWLPPSGRAGR